MTATAPSQPEPSIAELLGNDPALVDCLFLVMNGVPFDVAFSLDPDFRLAFVVIVGSLKGGEFDWLTHSWKQPK